MSRPLLPRTSSGSQLPTRRSRTTRLSTISGPAENAASGPILTRRVSVNGLSGAPKTQRTSKTSQKLVVLPSAPQTKPLGSDEFLTHGHETDTGVREYKSEAERMSKEQRKRAGFKRLTAYCIAESFKMKLLTSFLKREHNVLPRVFDEALYVVSIRPALTILFPVPELYVFEWQMYHLPLLPGYGPNSNIRSSVPAKSTGGRSILSRLSEAEENGYQGTYFTAEDIRSPSSLRDGYITSSSPVDTRKPIPMPPIPATPASEITISTVSEMEPPTPNSEVDVGAETDDAVPSSSRVPPTSAKPDEAVAEVVFFEYGVVVFFGLDEGQERGILEDLENAGILKRKINEDDWEIEECHFAVSSSKFGKEFFC